MRWRGEVGETKAEGYGDTRKGLIDPKALPLSRAVLCVVQRTPTRSRERGTTEREEAAWVREFASRVSDHQSCNVIAIPALHPDEATAAIRALGAALATFGRVGAPTPERLLNAMDAIRTAIVASVKDDERTRDHPLVQMAMDVCLFMNEEEK
jgi:hypothetical protein